jgi:hypothetical protein
MQQEYKPGTRREPDSLAPVQLERTSVAEDIALMKRGKSMPLLLSLVLATIAVAGGVRWMGTIDVKQSYAHAADRLEVIDSQQSEAFLRCALPNVQSSQLKSSLALHNAIENASERLDKFYGRQLTHCSHYLDDLSSQLGAVTVPADMSRQLASLREAAKEFGLTWNNYRAYLQDPSVRYDYVQATPLIEKITLAWGTYRAQQAQIKAVLRAHE